MTCFLDSQGKSPRLSLHQTCLSIYLCIYLCVYLSISVAQDLSTSPQAGIYGTKTITCNKNCCFELTWMSHWIECVKSVNSRLSTSQAKTSHLHSAPVMPCSNTFLEGSSGQGGTAVLLTMGGLPVLKLPLKKV